MNKATNIHTTVGQAVPTPNFYHYIDKQATYKAGKDMMALYQQQWRKTKKTGGINASTFDLFFALIRSIAPTMEDVRVNQPNWFADCEAKGEYFCFTSVPTLIQMMNNVQKHEVLGLCKKTVYNQIKRLLDVGIITKKTNYKWTGKRNPFPSEASERGRGKIQLWINPKVLQFKTAYGHAAPSDSQNTSSLEKGLPMYEHSSLLFNKEELKTIDNTAKDVDKKASAVAENKPSNIQGQEQGSKTNPSTQPRISPKDLKKKAFDVEKIWELMRFNLYGGKNFNEQTNIDSKELLELWLEQAAEHVQNFRKAKIQSYQQNPAFLMAKDKTKSLKKFAARLPKTDRCALEIVSHAVWKQRKHAEKHGYLQHLYYPVAYLSSKAAQDALHYSIHDWQRIQEQYFDKNQASKVYFEQIQWINKRYSAAIEEIHKNSYQKAYAYFKTQYQRWYQDLQNNPDLTRKKQEELHQRFIHLFKPLFDNYGQD